MTLHVVLGEGSINKRELAHQLDDLRDKAAQEEANFWLLVEGKDAPTQADQDLMSYCADNEVYVVTLAPDDLELDTFYETASENHQYSGEFADSLVEAMTELQEDNEGADLLTLLINPKEDHPDDEATIVVIEAVINAGFETFALNNSMEQIKLQEEAAPPPAAKKTATVKKAAPPKEESLDVGPYSKEELEAMSPPDVKALAQGMGVMGRGKADFIRGILAKQGDTSVSVAPVTPITSTTTNTAGSNVNWTLSGSNGDSLKEGEVLIVIHAPSGIRLKMVSAEKVAAL